MYIPLSFWHGGQYVLDCNNFTMEYKELWIFWKLYRMENVHLLLKENLQKSAASIW